MNVERLLKLFKEWSDRREPNDHELFPELVFCSDGSGSIEIDTWDEKSVDWTTELIYVFENVDQLIKYLTK